MKFAHYQNICVRMHAHLQLACTCISRNRSQILIMSHAYACLVYWFVLVQHTELHATKALKPAHSLLNHELAHTCTLYRAPINTQPDPIAVG